jgi:hypothetical protein
MNTKEEAAGRTVTESLALVVLPATAWWSLFEVEEDITPGKLYVPSDACLRRRVAPGVVVGVVVPLLALCPTGSSLRVPLPET